MVFVLTTARGSQNLEMQYLTDREQSDWHSIQLELQIPTLVHFLRDTNPEKWERLQSIPK
jgi:hypothetical protein